MIKAEGIQVHRDPRVFAELGDQWEELHARCPSATIFQSLMWNSLWWKHFGIDKHLFILTYRDHKEDLCGIAPFMAEAESGMTNGKMMFLGGLDVTDYQDLICLPGKERAFFQELQRFLCSEWKHYKIDLHFMRDSGIALNPVSALFRAEPWELDIRLEEVAPIILLPDSWERFLAGLSSKQRHEIRRKFGRASREGQIGWYRSERYSCLIEEDLPVFIELHRKSKPKKAVFMDSRSQAFFSDIAGWLYKENRLELVFLTFDGKRIASLFCFRDRRTMALYNSGYDPLFGPLSPGILVICRSIQKAIQEGYAYYDFLRGGETYKYRLGASDRPLYALEASCS